PLAQMKHELATTHISSIPLAIRERSLGLSQGSRECVVIDIALLQSHFIGILVHVWLPSYPSGLLHPSHPDGASQGFANHSAKVIDGCHQQEHDDQNGACLVILKHTHRQLDLLPKPPRADQP